VEHGCVTIFDHISVMTCALWHEEHFLNVSVLGTVHLSNPMKKYVTKNICYNVILT
jgi:hypothetical protein